MSREKELDKDLDKGRNNPCGYLKFSSLGTARAGLKEKDVNLMSSRMCTEVCMMGMQCMRGIIVRQEVREVTAAQIL